MDINEILGIIAAICSTGAFIPQAYKVYKTRETKSLSVWLTLLMTMGTTFWLIYGIMENDMPIIIANMIATPLNFYIFLKKLQYK